MIFPFSHIAHALHSIKELFEGGDDASTQSPEAERAGEHGELQRKLAAMNLSPAVRGQIAALIQSGDLHAARAAIRAAAIRPSPPAPEARRVPPPRRVVQDRRENLDRDRGGGFGF